MKKLKKLLSGLAPIILLPLLLILNISSAPALSDFDYNSASVLPFYTHRNVKYAVLSREIFGKVKGTYDDWGGSRDRNKGNRSEYHPLKTAAREFFEEGILDRVLGLTLEQVEKFIDVGHGIRNTHFIVANTTETGAKNITYITNFNKHITEFINNFYTELSLSTEWHNKEKDRIALVKWSDLTDAITSSDDPNNTFVQAMVINPIGNRKENKTIKLRPYLVIKLSKFFRDEPYICGKNRKIRFY